MAPGLVANPLYVHKKSSLCRRAIGAPANVQRGTRRGRDLTEDAWFYVALLTIGYLLSRVRPLGGTPVCLVMIAVSVGLSVLLTILLNLGR